MSVSDSAVMRLRAVVDADPSAVIRVLQQFQGRNLVVNRVSAERLGSDFIDVDVEIESSAITPEAFRAIVAKINQMASALVAVACE